MARPREISCLLVPKVAVDSHQEGKRGTDTPRNTKQRTDGGGSRGTPSIPASLAAALRPAEIAVLSDHYPHIYVETTNAGTYLLTMNHRVQKSGHPPPDFYIVGEIAPRPRRAPPLGAPDPRRGKKCPAPGSNPRRRSAAAGLCADRRARTRGRRAPTTRRLGVKTGSKGGG